MRTINLSETTATARRIPFMIYLDDGSVLADDGAAAAAPPVGTIQVSINGAAFANGAGTLAHLGRGEYYYEATLAEVGTPGFLAVLFSRTGYRTEIEAAQIGQIFGVGETDVTKLRWPLTIYGTSLEPPQLATGATVTAPSDLQTSLDGAALANAAGTLHEVGSGLYYYQAVAADAVVAGLLSVQYQSAGFATVVSTIEVTTGGIPTPVLSSITPTPNVPPGVTGAFSVDFRVARRTPITFLASHIGSGCVLTIQVSYADRNERYVAIDVDGGFCWPFDVPGDNTIGPLGSEPVPVRLLPRGGWPPTIVGVKVANARASA